MTIHENTFNSNGEDSVDDHRRRFLSIRSLIDCNSYYYLFRVVAKKKKFGIHKSSVRLLPSQG